jgi:hypothetical protein
MSEELAASKSALDTQDRLLGITDVRAQIQKEAEDLDAIGRDESKVRDRITGLEKDVASVQSKIRKLHAREGQVWLIPDRSSNPKEPILAIVSGTGLRIDRFNHPEQSQEFKKSGARAGLESYLKQAKSQDQYVVFLIRPSGIALFKQLVQTARDNGFEVGFDALEEDREIHFTAPPPIDDEATTEHRPLVINGEPSSGDTARGRYPGGYGTASARNGTASSGNGGIPGGNGTASVGTGSGSRDGSANGTGSAATTQAGQPSSPGSQTGSDEINRPGGTNRSPTGLTNGSTAGSGTNNGAATVSGTNGIPSAAQPPPPPPKPKSWWQRFLEWIGLG